MAIQDLAGNPLANGSQASLLGYTTPPSAAEVLNLDMYQFLLAGIRQQDLQNGQYFAKRYLQGPQTIWLQIQESLFEIKKLWSYTECPDEYLQYLKRIVGWTPRYDSLTSALDAAVLRRLIAASVPLWRRRGTEDALLDALRLITGARQQLWNWFDFRWIVGETILEEVRNGNDPWVVSAPGEGTSEYTSNLRIVDDGSLNRTLVRELLNLMRPIGERFEITYLDFLDLFTVVDDTTQWTQTSLVVDNNVASLSNNAADEYAQANVNGSDAWSKYMAYWAISSTSSTPGALAGGTVYSTDVNNGYRAGIDVAGNRVQLVKMVSGTPTVLADIDYTPFGTLGSGIRYGLRVQIVPEFNTNRIQVWLDAIEITSVTDDTYTQGAVGLFHDTGAIAEYNEVEVMSLPPDAETIDINS